MKTLLALNNVEKSQGIQKVTSATSSDDNTLKDINIEHNWCLKALHCFKTKNYGSKIVKFEFMLRNPF